MKRTLVDWSDHDFLALNALSEAKQVTRAERTRQSVSQYIEKFKSEPAIDTAFGLLARKKRIGWPASSACGQNGKSTF